MMNDHKVITWPTARGLGWVDTQPFSDWYIPLNDWCIKDIKRCLLQARLNTFGTKTVLVARLQSYLSIENDYREHEHVLDPAVIQAEGDKQ